TLRRFAIAACGFGRSAPTVPVADCGPGEEVQLDTGWMILLAPDAHGRRRRFRAWIFTAVYSRYRFVYPCFGETTASAIEACEAAWAFFGGVFRVLIPDNTKAIVATADPLQPHAVAACREYTQARGFHVDPTRVRHPRDKARVERSVPSVREDCFGGEVLRDLTASRTHAVTWCRDDYGGHIHTRTQRRPREHFEAEEQAHLRPAPTEPYDIPLWSTPRVARDPFAQVAQALYTLPTRFIGHARRFGAARVEAGCADAVAVELFDVHRLKRMLVHARAPESGPAPAAVPPARYLRPVAQYALRPVSGAPEGGAA